METEIIIHTALFSALLGFLAFCASYAFHVWRSRNAAARCDGAPARAGRLLRWSFSSIVLGCVLLLVSSIWREVKPREGILSGQGLYSVRAEKGLQVEYVAPLGRVEKGDVLARFGSPQHRAEITELKLKHQILEVQREAVELQPLTPDGELVRRHEKCVADQRQLLASLSYLIPEHAVVIRERLRDSMDRAERLNALNTRMDTARRELEQATARHWLAEKHVARTQVLSTREAAADIELDERRTDFLVARGEVAKLEASLADMEIEQKHLQDSTPLFAACTSRQAEDMDREMVRVREQLSATVKELQESQSRLEADRRRAERLKVQTLAQLDLEIRQHQARLEGLQDVLAVQAPFKGVIAYADPAPGAALPAAPIVVLTPEQGFRVRLRMTEAEAGPLSQAKSATLGLVAPVLQRRFPGRLARCQRLPDEPGYCLAELECTPPPETIRELAAHDWGARDWQQVPTMRVRLLWRPPLYVFPAFLPAVCLLAAGCLGCCAAGLARFRSRTARFVEQGGKQPASLKFPLAAPVQLPAGWAMPAPSTRLGLDAADLEAGALGRNLQLLGQRLREAIKRQCIEPPLLRAAEWAIDRHHTRAIQHLAAGLDHDPDLPSGLQKLLERAGADLQGHLDHQSDGLDGETLRLFRIIRTVAPELLKGREIPTRGRHTPERREAGPERSSRLPPLEPAVEGGFRESS